MLDFVASRSTLDKAAVSAFVVGRSNNCWAPQQVDDPILGREPVGQNGATLEINRRKTGARLGAIVCCVIPLTALVVSPFVLEGSPYYRHFGYVGTVTVYA